MALFNPQTFSPQQASMLTNVPGKSLSETNTPEQLLSAGSLQGTMTTPQAPTSQPTTGTQKSNPMAFALAMQAFQQGYQRDNQLMQQRNLLLRSIHGPVLSDQEKLQLDPEYKSLVDSGNVDQINMNIRLLGDQAVGATKSIDSSLKFLTDTYQRSIEQAEKQREDSLKTTLEYAKALGQ